MDNVTNRKRDAKITEIRWVHLLAKTVESSRLTTDIVKFTVKKTEKYAATDEESHSCQSQSRQGKFQVFWKNSKRASHK